MLGKLVLDQALGGILEAFLDLTNADRSQALFVKAILDKQISEEMGLAGTAAAVNTLISRRIQKWQVYPRRWDAEGR
jgi:hypothetical protein